ncbi:MAG TPA: LytR C-terminal domain-containing protein [Gemmatimonadaceae bacterium]|nr:LytR C-terminal domain-containing protein [Gemmatimonadaceae bacterium]
MTTRARWLIAVLVVAVVGVAATALTMRARATPVRSTALGRLVTREVTAPPNTRIRVEIINATRTSGLARRVTRLLRDRGFDVVKYTTSTATQDTTVVLDRTEHPEWAKLVGQALGAARVEARPDTSRYVDVTVVLGSAWRAPPQPFSP